MTKEALKRHLISLAITFVATFFLVMSFEISDPAFVFTATSLKVLALSALIAGARAVAKIIYEIAYSLLSK